MSKIPVEYYNQDDSNTVMIKSRWWLQKDVHPHVFGVVKKIKESQTQRMHLYLNFVRWYLGRAVNSIYGGIYRYQASDNLNQNGLSYNVIKSCIDTVSSKIAKTKPRPIFLTDGGSFDLQRKSKLLNQFIIGCFDMAGNGAGDDRTIYGVGRQVFQDACIFGTGVAKFYVNDDNVIKVERVLPNEIIIDEVEGKYKRPRQIHQCTHVPREVLIDLFPKSEGFISSAPCVKQDYEQDTSADMVEVIESWHLPSGKKAKDGKHSICISNATLFEEEYTKDYFPFLFQRWSNAPVGFFGRGIADELSGIQLEINKILRNIQKSIRLQAIPQVWIDYQSQVVSKHINNEVGGIKYYANKPPVFHTPAAMSGDVYRHLETLYQKAFEVVGVSQLAAQSLKPSGLDSGRALREFQDIESERFALTSQMYEDFFVDAAVLMYRMLEDLYEKKVNVEINARGSDSFKKMKFSDVKIPLDSIIVRPYPTNFLPTTPAGKIQSVEELIRAGILDQKEALELLDFPDLSKVKKLKLASSNSVTSTIEMMIEDGVYRGPEPFMDLQYAQKMAQAYYLSGKVDEIPEDRLGLILQFLQDVKELMAPPEPPMPEATAPMPGEVPPMPEGAPPMPGDLPPELMGALPPDMAGAEMPPEAAGPLPPVV